jgi:hypothetical protein
MVEEKNWIKKALKNHKEHSLHKMLKWPITQPLPEDLLLRIKKSVIGSLIVYRYLGRYGWVTRKYKVTLLMKQRAVLAYTLKGLGAKHRYSEHVLKNER